MSQEESDTFKTPPKQNYYLNTNASLSEDRSFSRGTSSRSVETSPLLNGPTISRTPSVCNTDYRKQVNLFGLDEDDRSERMRASFLHRARKNSTFEFFNNERAILEKAEIVKKQTDEDLKTFEKEYKSFKFPAKGYYCYDFCKQVEVQLFDLSSKIQKTSLTELKAGKHRLYMSELEKLNRFAETQKIDDFVKETRKMIRKMIFILSRCSRIVGLWQTIEHKRMTEQAQQEKILRPYESSKQQKQSNIVQLQSISTSNSNVVSSNGLNKDQQQQQQQHPPAKKTLMDNFLSIFSVGQAQKTVDEPQHLLCRICEEMVDSKTYAEHSNLCAARHHVDSKLLAVDEKIRKKAALFKKKKGEMSLQENNLLNELFKITEESSELGYDKEGLLQLQNNMKRYSDICDSLENEVFYNYSLKILDLLKMKETFVEEKMKVGGGKPKRKIRITDFDIIRPISRGAYGRVFLAKKKKTKDVFAIKVLKKEEMSKKKQYKRVMAERDILAMSSNNFVVKLYYSFQAPEYLYLVMEYIAGGDLFTLLQKEYYLPEEIVKQYAAEILLALEYLHGNKIIHRDLKPDNVVIGIDGHVKLTDFGLSEIGLYQNDLILDDLNASTMIADSPLKKSASQEDNLQEIFGTPDYIAPELLLGQEHSYPVDMWSFGIVVFELLTGCPPFNDVSPEQIFDNILSLDINWPKEGHMSTAAVDLIKKLLVLDPKERLSIPQVKEHPFFAKVNWKTILNEKPFFIPKIQNDEDTSNFDGRKSHYAVEDLDVGTSGSLDDHQLAGCLTPNSPVSFSFLNTANLAKITENELNSKANNNIKK